MATIVIQISDDEANEIAEWIKTHSRMLLSSTVPALHHWTIPVQNISITP